MRSLQEPNPFVKTLWISRSITGCRPPPGCHHCQQKHCQQKPCPHQRPQLNCCSAPCPAAVAVLPAVLRPPCCTHSTAARRPSTAGPSMCYLAALLYPGSGQSIPSLRRSQHPACPMHQTLLRNKPRVITEQASSVSFFILLL